MTKLIQSVALWTPLAFMQAAQAAAEAPAVSPSALGFSVESMDRAADPCVDFYQFACGGWLAKNEIPSDQPRWGRFNELDERNRRLLRDTLEQASDASRPRDAVTQKIGDYYASCMDEKAIDAEGIAPLMGEMDRVMSLPDKSQLAAEAARLHKVGANVLFSFDSDIDAKDSAHMIAEVDEGGLGLPDRDYYLKQDEKSAQTRRQYSEHVQKMLQLLGDTTEQAKAAAQTILDIETDLAKVSLSRTDRRDPNKIYHKLHRGELDVLAPSLSWKEYFAGSGSPAFKSLNVTEPDFFKGMETVLKKYDLASFKVYLQWHLLHASAQFLPAPFVDETFDFYDRKIRGQKEIKARWKRCGRFTDAALGEALGQAYVKKYFPPESKERMLKMVHALEEAMKEDLQNLSWMTPKTRKLALRKLAAIENKIGYPEKWRDYTKLEIVRGDALGNSQRATAFESKRRLNKIGQSVDKQEWEMTPPTVNAYYSPEMNNINFPAGILQPPFFDASLDDAVNLGGIGVIIGHELTHGFDDAGRQFDAQGNLKDWWTPEDAKEFEKRASCLVDEYAGFVATADVHLNGKLTLGENTADNGGARLALMALKNQGSGKDASMIDGFTPEQRLFLGFGQVWCEKRSGESSRMLAIVDPHSPGRFRITGVVSNMPEFQEAFHCKAGSPMVRANSCRVW